MKYIDADRLCSEIDRRILQEQGFEDGDAECGYKCALKDIKRFITSHQQEQPSLPSNLDEAAKDRVTENGRFELTESGKMRIDDIMFGAEWMAGQGETKDGEVLIDMRTGDLTVRVPVDDNKYQFNEKVLVQIRKK